MMVRFRSTRFAQRFFRFSPCSRGEHEGEGFEQGEATCARCVVQIF
jgi:hypothetical protein